MATKNLAIFDIDRTLIKGQSQEALLKFIYKKGYIKNCYYIKIIFWFVLYKLHIVKNPKKIMEYAFSVFGGKSEQEVKEIINEFFNEDLKGRFYGDGIKLVNELKDKRFRIILISNAVDVLVEKIAEYLAVNDFRGTTLEVKDGKLTGKIEGPIVYGVEKSNIVKKYISDNNIELDNVYAYGDHISDVFMLELAKHPFVVNPSNNLRNIAVKRNWPILIFK
ncbi:MAG: HAD-superfamily hydrolase [Parcubacteria group bacterium LiPW_30]|nr:MAG: HAD-superfamily hydrolase [Parcubacteria group bacterium LiPW_30]